MKKFLFFLGMIVLGAGLIGLSVQREKLPSLQASIFDLGEKIQAAQYDYTKWEDVIAEAESLPSIYPLSRVKSALLEIRNVIHEGEILQETSEKLLNEKLETETFFAIFDSINRIDESLENIADDLDSIPDFFLTDSILQQRDWVLRMIKISRENLSDIHKFESVFRTFAENEERLLILLQNQNEPRSTGGFVGSMIVVDFTEKEIQWKFSDIYALDREVPAESQFPAPEFFHDLSKNISLRDANFWPDFEQTSEKYRHFFDALDQKTPNTVLAINLNLIKELLHFTGPIKLTQWGVTLDEYNFDLVLQFLVEGKVTGRFDTKQPVVIFAEALLTPKNFQNIHAEEFMAFDWQSFIAQKNILAHSQNSSLQKLFEKWKIDGRIRQKRDVDNFLHFDFVSIGANKSEKFVWTKLWHDSEILSDGTVRNSLHITRNHALKKGEISELLKESTWSENLRELLTEELLWKLGAGQNRTMLRVWVPREIKITGYQNPSGTLGSTFSEDKEFRILEIPLFVGPGEKLEATVEYETKIHRGSVGWRPYFLQLAGTPGRDKTTFLTTISTPHNGSFRADTKNIGRPDNLVDTDFRAVIEFEQQK